MHNVKGAFSETLYIYGRAVAHTLQHNYSPSFLSLGLGLGYNELLTTAYLLRVHNEKPWLLEQLRAETFEAVPQLNENFLNWLAGSKINEEFEIAYEKIAQLCAEEFGVPAERLKTTLFGLIEDGQWVLRDSLSNETQFHQTFSCYFFDAFSSKTSPELWDETFLTNFFKATAQPKAVLSTYACTGTLKRALAKNEFQVEIKPGFAGKRESTFAYRET